MDDDVARAARARKGTPFLSTDQAAFYLGLSPRKLQQMRKDGKGPAFRRHSRYVRYHIDDLDNWSRQFINDGRLNLASATVSPGPGMNGRVETCGQVAEAPFATPDVWGPARS